MAKQEFDELKQLDGTIKQMSGSGGGGHNTSSGSIGTGTSNNPYTWFTIETLKDTWRSLEKAIKERESDLNVELERQEHNDLLRKEYAIQANKFYEWLQQTRYLLINNNQNDQLTLEQQLDKLSISLIKEIKEHKQEFKLIEELNLKLEERLILDNKYTEHTTLSLAQAYDQLDQLAMRMKHNLEQQIQAKLQSGVSEEQLREFSMMFKHFDKQKCGKLTHDEFKSCLRALGYDLPIEDDVESDKLFKQILDQVDPQRDGHVNLQDFMAFMISRETENISSINDVLNAFKALTENSDRPYITREELASVSTIPLFLLFPSSFSYSLSFSFSILESST